MSSNPLYTFVKSAKLLSGVEVEVAVSVEVEEELEEEEEEEEVEEEVEDDVEVEDVVFAFGVGEGECVLGFGDGFCCCWPESELEPESDPLLPSSPPFNGLHDIWKTPNPKSANEPNNPLLISKLPYAHEGQQSTTVATSDFPP